MLQHCMLKNVQPCPLSVKPCPFSIVLDRDFLLYLSIDPFSIKIYAKVSHRNSSLYSPAKPSKSPKSDTGEPQPAGLNIIV